MIKQLADAFADQFYHLERELFPRDRSEDSSVVQFTACNSGEGVTSVTLAFAAFMAKIHGPDSIIVVEGNFRQPSFDEIFKLEPGRSFMQTVRSSVSIESVIQKANDCGFSVIAAGEAPAKAAPMACEPCLDHLRQTLVELRKKYRCILVDSPPVIPFIDSTIIAGMVDQVVLVVTSNETRSEVVNHATDKLEASGANIAGIVLNKREFFIPKWAYHFL